MMLLIAILNLAINFLALFVAFSFLQFLVVIFVMLYLLFVSLCIEMCKHPMLISDINIILTVIAF